MKKLVPILLSGAILLGTTSCKKESDASTTTLSDALITALNKEVVEEVTGDTLSTLPRHETLYLVGFQWDEPNSFNPLNGWPSWPTRSEFNLMYEQLTSYNSLTGKTEPLLGRLKEDETNNQYVTIILNNSAEWSDGTPLTAEDVKFSYELNMNHPEAPCSYIGNYLEKITVDTLVTDIVGDDSTVVGTLAEARLRFHVDTLGRNNPGALVDYISNIPILPEHIFEPMLETYNHDLGRLTEDIMDYPQVISGPYNLENYSNEKIILKRRDDYWGNDAFHGGRMAQPKYVVHPIYKGNEHSSNALKHGDLDISSNFMPRIWMKKGVGSWYSEPPYFKAGSVPMFIINTTKAPLDNRHFRRAMAFAIDYEKVNNLAFSGYSMPINSGLIMPFSAESTFYSQEQVDEYGASRFDPAKVAEELALAGITSHYEDTASNGEFGNLVCMTHEVMKYDTTINGETTTIDSALITDTLPTLSITSPSGWSDFESMIKLAVKSMRVNGIDIREGFVDASQYWPAQSSGEFDLFMDTPSAKLTSTMPWARFEKSISALHWKPVGEKMYENIGRFNQPDTTGYIPEIDSLLGILPRMTDSTEIRRAYTALNKHFMEQQPTIPLLYRPEEFYQFSTKHWVNFPTAEKDALGNGGAYLPPHMPVAGVGTRLLWEIKPATMTEAH